jgi:Neutral/alkaline non-lysosomal ceramidase, N-terminal
MLKSMALGLLMVWLAPVALAPIPTAALRGGVAKVEITPGLGLAMYGYSNRTNPSKGLLDPLYARVLALEAGEARLALVTLDLGRVFRKSWIEQLRETVRKSSNVSYVLLVASHTHSGPALQDDCSPKPSPTWETESLGKIAKAIDEAYQRLVPVQLGTGYGTAYIGHNRLRINADGMAAWFERNLTKVPTSPVDPTVSVMRFDRADGKPLAVLVNYACHPVVFGRDNLQYSADYPGVMMKTVEQAFDGAPLCFFLPGAAGDINPYFAVTPLEEDAIKMRDWTGEQLGQAAIRVARNIKTQPAEEATLNFSEDLLPARLRWNAEKIRQELIKSRGKQAADDFVSCLKPEFQLPVTTVLINKQIALMGMPGEPFVEFQMSWRARCPVRDAFFLGYTNGSFGYFPTIQSTTRGGYGAATLSTQVEVGAGERMVDHALIKVYKMLGQLNDLPQGVR